VATQDLIETGVRRFIEEVPALAPLKLEFQLELIGRGDVQMFRVVLPGPEVSKGIIENPRITISMPRSHFNELATDGKVSHYRAAYESGQIKVGGDEQIKKLIATVVDRQEQRARTKKVH
jgi:hypothetical protein